MRLDPSRPLAGPLLKTDDTTLALKAEHGKIRARARSWDDAIVIGTEEVLEIVAIDNQLYVFARPRSPAYTKADPTGMSDAGYGPVTK